MSRERGRRGRVVKGGCRIGNRSRMTTAEIPDARPLADRARPQRLDEVIGNSAAREGLARWAEAWATSTSPPAHRAALLEGPPGVGKTTAALAVAADHGWTVVEMNASDARNEVAINLVAGRASLTHPLGEMSAFELGGERGRSLILLDEADCLTGRATEEGAERRPRLGFRDFLRTRYVQVEALTVAWGLVPSGKTPVFSKWDDLPQTPGRGAWTKLATAQRDIADWRGVEKPRDVSDRGGMAAIARLVRDTRQPLVLTVNDVEPLTRYSPIFRTGVARLRFYPVGEAELRQLLRRVAVREKVALSSEALDAILRRARGDVRGALNDLDAISPLPPGPAQVSVLGGRDQVADMYALVEEVFARPRFFRSVELRDRVDATPDDILPWMEENLPRSGATGNPLWRAMETVGRAELLLARARRQRVWALWSFAGELVTGGVGLASVGGSGGSQFRVAFPQFLGAMGRSRSARALRQSTLGKAGGHWHFSRKKGVEVALPFLGTLFAARSGLPPPALALRRKVARELALTPEELGFLLGAEPTAKSVSELIAPEPAAIELAESPRVERPTEGKKPPLRPRRERPPKAPPRDAPAKSAKTPAAGRKKVQRQLAEF